MIFINSNNYHNLCTNFTMENYRKYTKNFFKRLLLSIFIKPGLLISKIALFNKFQAVQEKNQFCTEVFCGIRWNKMSLKTITRVRILSALSKQNKFHVYWLLLNYIKYYFHIFCIFFLRKLFLFWNLWVRVILLFRYWSYKTHLTGHLDQINLGIVDVPASEKNKMTHLHSKDCVFCVLLSNVALAKYYVLFYSSFCEYVYLTHRR